MFHRSRIVPASVLVVLAWASAASADDLFGAPLPPGAIARMESARLRVQRNLNTFAVASQWDPYPFILLNLAFSTQAAYAAPLILLAQNRQDDRDRISLEEDRARAERTKADTEYLARELAALRLAVGETVTRDYLRGELEKLAERIGERPGAADPGRLSRPADG